MTDDNEDCFKYPIIFLGPITKENLSYYELECLSLWANKRILLFTSFVAKIEYGYRWLS